MCTISFFPLHTSENACLEVCHKQCRCKCVFGDRSQVVWMCLGVYLVTSLRVDVNVHLETNQQNDLSVQQNDLSVCLKTNHKAVWMQSCVPGNKSQSVCGCYVYNGDKSQAVRM